MRSLFSCRPVRDDTFVTADFNRRTTYKKCFFCLVETTSDVKTNKKTQFLRIKTAFKLSISVWPICFG